MFCILYAFLQKRKTEFNWWTNVINDFVYFYHKCLQGLLMYATFIFFDTDF